MLQMTVRGEKISWTQKPLFLSKFNWTEIVFVKDRFSSSAAGKASSGCQITGGTGVAVVRSTAAVPTLTLNSPSPW